MARQLLVSGVWFALALILASPLLAAGSAAVTTANDRYQSLAAIHKVVYKFLEEQAQGPGVIDRIVIEHLDPRLRLTACGGLLQPFLPNGQPSAGRLTVGVRCPGPKPWRLYVPAQITRHIEVLVAARPLPRGVVLTQDAIRHERRNVAELSRVWYMDSTQLLGLETRQAIRAGEMFSPQLLTSPRLIHRGQELILFASSGTMTVTMKGEALEDGAEGDVVRVRNLSSDRIVEGRVVGIDKVQVSL